MTTKTLDLNNIERKIFWVMVSLVSVAAAFYLYSVASLTLAVVDRDHMNRTAHELSNIAGTLEAEYLAQTNSITLAYAQSIGFHEVNVKFAGDTGTKISMAR